MCRARPIGRSHYLPLWGRGTTEWWMRLFLTQHIATSSVLLRNPPSPKGKVRRETSPRPTYHLRLGEDFTAERFHMIYHISPVLDGFHCGTPCHLPPPYGFNYAQRNILLCESRNARGGVTRLSCACRTSLAGAICASVLVSELPDTLSLDYHCGASRHSSLLQLITFAQRRFPLYSHHHGKRQHKAKAC